MRIVLDTHALLWFIMGNAQLSRRARELIEEPGNVRLLSMASLWEMAIKASLGKLILAQPFSVLFPRILHANDIELLAIGVEHVAAVATLPFYHRDPFDRMIVAQSMVEDVPVLSADSTLDRYAIERLW